MGLPPNPAWGHCPQTSSPLRGGFKGLGWNQVSLCFLILAFLRFAIDETGVTMGLPPQTPLGDIVPKPLLRFAAVLRGY